MTGIHFRLGSSEEDSVRLRDQYNKLVQDQENSNKTPDLN